MTVFPNVSLAVHVIVVVPVGKELGASFEKVNEQLSLTVGIPRIITQEFDVMFGGGVIPVSYTHLTLPTIYSV